MTFVKDVAFRYTDVHTAQKESGHANVAVH